MSFRILIIVLLLSRLQMGACRMRFPEVPGPPSALAYENVDTQIPSAQKSKLSAKEFRSCLPKGFRPPPSAPSHFGNSHALDSFTLCSSQEDTLSKP